MRFMAQRPVLIPAAEGDEFKLGSGGKQTFHARIPEPFSPTPEGFAPIGLFIVESGGIRWAWEFPLRPLPGEPQISPSRP